MAEETKDYEGFIDQGMDTDDVHEPLPVPTAAYDLTVTSAKGIKEDDGNGNTIVTKVQVRIDFDGMPNAATLFHSIPIVKPTDEPKSKNYKIILQKKFCKLFNVPYSNRGFNTTDLIGAQAKGALVDLSSYQDKNTGATKENNKLNLDSVHV